MGFFWELRLVNTGRLSDEVALSNLTLLFSPLRLLDENRLLAEIVGLSSAHALATKIIQP
jgi:hypothetical protein